MTEAKHIQGPFGHVLTPERLKLTFEDAYQAISQAVASTAEPVNRPTMYGAALWIALTRRGADPVEVDRTVDRLPLHAFDCAGDMSFFVPFVLSWAHKGAPGRGQAARRAKEMLVRAGWRPSQVNSDMMTKNNALHIFGAGEDFFVGERSLKDLERQQLTPRQRETVAYMKRKAAF